MPSRRPGVQPKNAGIEVDEDNNATLSHAKGDAANAVKRSGVRKPNTDDKPRAREPTLEELKKALNIATKENTTLAERCRAAETKAFTSESEASEREEELKNHKISLDRAVKKLRKREEEVLMLKWEKEDMTGRVKELEGEVATKTKKIAAQSDNLKQKEEDHAKKDDQIKDLRIQVTSLNNQVQELMVTVEEGRTKAKKKQQELSATLKHAWEVLLNTHRSVKDLAKEQQDQMEKFEGSQTEEEVRKERNAKNSNPILNQVRHKSTAGGGMQDQDTVDAYDNGEVKSADKTQKQKRTRAEDTEAEEHKQKRRAMERAVQEGL